MNDNSKIRPLGSRILVERLENDVKTESGLFIPDSAQEKQQKGKVVAVGKGYVKEDGTYRAMDITAGDTIVFGKYAGNEVKIDGEELLIMKEEDIYGVLEA